MARVIVVRPEFETKDVSFEVPDRVFEWVSGDRLRASGRRAALLGQAAGPTLADRWHEASPAIGKTLEVVRTQAGELGARGAEVVSAARRSGEVLAQKAGEEWVPAAQQQVQKTSAGLRPRVSDARQRGAQRLDAAAAAAGTAAATAAYSTRHAARASADAVGYATKETFRLAMWGSVVGWLLMYIFQPDPAKRRRTYRRIRRALGI